MELVSCFRYWATAYHETVAASVRITGQRGGSRFSLVDADRIAVGVGDERHVADGRVLRLPDEFHAALLQAVDGGVKVVHFQTGTAAVGRRFPVVGEIRDRERARTDVILDPRFVLVAPSPAFLQAERFGVKLARAFHVGDRIGGEGDFDDFHGWRSYSVL